MAQPSPLSPTEIYISDEEPEELLLIFFAEEEPTERTCTPTTPSSPTPMLSPTVSYHGEPPWLVDAPLAGIPEWDDDSDIEMPELQPMVAPPAAPPPAGEMPEVPPPAPAGAMPEVLPPAQAELAQPEPDVAQHPNDDDGADHDEDDAYNDLANPSPDSQ